MPRAIQVTDINIWNHKTLHLKEGYPPFQINHTLHFRIFHRIASPDIIVVVVADTVPSTEKDRASRIILRLMVIMKKFSALKIQDWIWLDAGHKLLHCFDGIDVTKGSFIWHDHIERKNRISWWQSLNLHLLSKGTVINCVENLRQGQF